MPDNALRSEFEEMFPDVKKMSEWSKCDDEAVLLQRRQELKAEVREERQGYKKIRFQMPVDEPAALCR